MSHVNFDTSQKETIEKRKEEMRHKREAAANLFHENDGKEIHGRKMADVVYFNKDYVNAKEKFNATSLTKMVEEHLENDYKKRQELRETKEEIRYYPSSVGRCLRETTYRMLKYPATPKSGTNLQVLENGNSFHQRMEDTLADMGIMVAPELSLKDESLCIYGRSDAIVWNFLDDAFEEEEDTSNQIELYNTKDEVIYVGPKNRVLLVDFKSIQDKSFNKLPKKKPKKEHEMQLQLYFYLTGINKGILYYENKNNQQTTEYVIERNDKIISDVLEEIKYCVDLAKQRELAPRLLKPTDVQCRYCDFREICWPNAAPFTFEDLFIEEVNE